MRSGNSETEHSDQRSWLCPQYWALGCHMSANQNFGYCYRQCATCLACANSSDWRWVFPQLNGTDAFYAVAACTPRKKDHRYDYQQHSGRMTYQGISVLISPGDWGQTYSLPGEYFLSFLTLYIFEVDSAATPLSPDIDCF